MIKKIFNCLPLTLFLLTFTVTEAQQPKKSHG